MEPWQLNPKVLGEPVALIWLSESAPEGELWPTADGRSWLCHPKTWAQIQRQMNDPEPTHVVDTRGLEGLTAARLAEIAEKHPPPPEWYHRVEERPW